MFVKIWIIRAALIPSFCRHSRGSGNLPSFPRKRESSGLGDARLLIAVLNKANHNEIGI